MRLEIDMQPARPALPGELDRSGHQGGADALALRIRIDDGVEQEGVLPAVPGDIDEADETNAGIGAEVSEAAGQDRVGSSRSRSSMAVRRAASLRATCCSPRPASRPSP